MPPATATDGELVEAFQRGDARAFDGLFQRYQRPIFNYILRMTGNPATSEDLAQEAFLRVFTSLGKAGDLANFRAWLYRITTNVTISHFRKKQQGETSLEASLADGALPELAGAASSEPEGQHLRREEMEEAGIGLLRLSELHRQVLILRQLQGLSYAEIGEIMGISTEAVTSLLHRARLEFKAQIEALRREGPADGTARRVQKR